jgi:hypothetical protein
MVFKDDELDHFTHTPNNDRYLWKEQWLRYYATNRKVTGSIPDGVIGIFH